MAVSLLIVWAALALGAMAVSAKTLVIDGGSVLTATS